MEQAGIEPDGLRVTKKMDVVAAGSELGPKRGRQDSAAANQRKTNDPNFERRWHF